MSNLNNDSQEQVQTNQAVKPLNRIDKFFGITERGSSIKAEIIAGIVTFLAMCYILTVNPNQFFWGGVMGNNGPTFTATDNPYWTSVFIATAFGAIVGTLLMAFLAKLPLAQAPGMGLNSLVGSIIGGGVGFGSYHFSFSLANAMFMVLISGILFLILSIVSIKGVSLRQKIFEGIPAAIRTAIPVGIGLFIAYIGFQNAGFIVTNQYTQVAVLDFSKWEEQIVNWGSSLAVTPANGLVLLGGLFVIAILDHFKVKGAVIIGILAATVLGIPLGVTNLSVVTGSEAGITWKFWENFANYFGENGVFGLAVTEGFNLPAGSIMTAIMLIITMCMIDMFDTMGTCVGCCSAAGLMDENGVPLNYNKIMYADSIATCTGALFGTSTVTTFVESGAGIATGGKTGLTALTTAIMFFLAIFALPVFAMIPSAAAASALVYVGVLMMKNIKNVDFSDIRTAVPAFLAIAIMPLGYSITKGIGWAILSYVVISVICYVVDIIKYAITKKEKPAWNVSIVTIIVAVLFIIYFFVPTIIK
ncbi:MAG: NCS2 family permease [Clostridia bacterium]|nr:NCS2 family permease [Clostridia bacterium]